jgi:hypothetical protein
MNEAGKTVFLQALEKSEDVLHHFYPYRHQRRVAE